MNAPVIAEHDVTVYQGDSKSRRYWFDLDAVRVPASDASIQRAKNPETIKPRGNSAAVPGEKRSAFQPWDPTRLLTLGMNPGDVWSIASQGFAGAHFACMPPDLARRCILAGCPQDGAVLDPFAGSGTTLMVARQLARRAVGIELNPAYIDIIRQRIGQAPLDFGTASA